MAAEGNAKAAAGVEHMEKGGRGVTAGQDYYEIMGVSPFATQAELREAYRRRARSLHPDAGGSEHAMSRLNEAWRCLRDPARRAAYDRERAMRLGPRSAARPGAARDAATGAPFWPYDPYDLQALPPGAARLAFAALFGQLGFAVQQRGPQVEADLRLTAPDGAVIAVALHVPAAGTALKRADVVRAAVEALLAGATRAWLVTDGTGDAAVEEVAGELGVGLVTAPQLASLSGWGAAGWASLLRTIPEFPAHRVRGLHAELRQSGQWTAIRKEEATPAAEKSALGAPLMGAFWGAVTGGAFFGLPGALVGGALAGLVLLVWANRKRFQWRRVAK